MWETWVLSLDWEGLEPTLVFFLENPQEQRSLMVTSGVAKSQTWWSIAQSSDLFKNVIQIQQNARVKVGNMTTYIGCCCCHLVVSNSLPNHGPQHAWPPYPSPSPGAHPCLLGQSCHPTIASAISFSCLQSFSASGSFLMSQLFASGGQSIGASASVLPTNIQDWFPLGCTGLIFWLSKGISRDFSNITPQKHQFFGFQPFLRSNSHIGTWLLEKP